MAADAESSMLESLKRRAFAIAVDGSNDSGSQMYPIVATYYVEESRNVESRLLCLQELHGEATGRKIGNLVLDALKVKFSSESTGHASLTREERLFYFLTSDVNLAYGLFLKNVIPIFERVNCQLQSQAPQVHLLQSLLVQLLRDLMARFVNPSAMKACASPLEVPYQDLKNQKADEDLILGSRTLSVVEGLPTSDKQQFFSAVRQYFAVACDYIRHKFPLEDATLKKAEVANLKFLSSASFKSLGFFIESFPQLLSQEKNMSREEALDALEVEFAELQAYDVSKDILNEERIDVKWSEVGRITSIDGKEPFGLGVRLVRSRSARSSVARRGGVLKACAHISPLVQSDPAARPGATGALNAWASTCGAPENVVRLVPELHNFEL
ncbi:hypothetical protein HPB47_006602 [Ixodes persulcatus]|uniref:Uncharacterized protein n=1 Tax=Ixodes persulcatus TaxID=34615 RepID=A0AC60P9W0_IXOPE|nr:hypothetical protein HPB47_006602 [Ixodes persulcatus]